MSQTRSSWSSSVRGARQTVIDPPGPRSTFWALGAVASMVITASALSGMHLVTLRWSSQPSGARSRRCRAPGRRRAEGSAAQPPPNDRRRLPVEGARRRDLRQTGSAARGCCHRSRRTPCHARSSPPRTHPVRRSSARRSRRGRSSSCPAPSASTRAPGAWRERPSRSRPGQALTNCETILRAAGAGLDDVVEVGVLLADPADFAGFNEEWARWFPSDPPAVRRQAGRGRARAPRVDPHDGVHRPTTPLRSTRQS